jgi:hypothetical protein
MLMFVIILIIMCWQTSSHGVAHGVSSRWGISKDRIAKFLALLIAFEVAVAPAAAAFPWTPGVPAAPVDQKDALLEHTGTLRCVEKLPLCEARADWLEQELTQNKKVLDLKTVELDENRLELGREKQQRQVAEQLVLQFEEGWGVSSRDGGGGAVVSEQTPRQEQAPPFSFSFEASPSTSFVVAAPRRLTTITVDTESGLTNALASSTTIELAANITLDSTVTINGLIKLVIDGKGLNIDGGDTVQCFDISGGASMTLMDLTITRGYAVSWRAATALCEPFLGKTPLNFQIFFIFPYFICGGFYFIQTFSHMDFCVFVCCTSPLGLVFVVCCFGLLCRMW